MAGWDKTENGYFYEDRRSGKMEVVIVEEAVTLRYDGWYVNKDSLKDLADQIMWLRKELYGE